MYCFRSQGSVGYIQRSDIWFVVVFENNACVVLESQIGVSVERVGCRICFLCALCSVIETMSSTSYIMFVIEPMQVHVSISLNTGVSISLNRGVSISLNRGVLMI